jgi:hypothetical protein
MREVASPRSSGAIGFERVLLLGAAVGLLGWSATQALTWWPGLTLGVPVVVTIVALWLLLTAGLSAVCLFRCTPDILRSRPVLVWTTVASLAMVTTLGGLAGVVPSPVAFWYVWVGACAVGYLSTGVLFVGATDDDQLYLTAGLLSLALLGIGGLSFTQLESGLYLPLAVVHVVPLVLAAHGPRRGRVRPALLAVVFTLALAVGLAL